MSVWCVEPLAYTHTNRHTISDHHTNGDTSSPEQQLTTQHALTGEDHFSGDEDQQDYPRLDHAVDQAREQFRFVAVEWQPSITDINDTAHQQYVRLQTAGRQIPLPNTPSSTNSKRMPQLDLSPGRTDVPAVRDPCDMTLVTAFNTANCAQRMSLLARVVMTIPERSNVLLLLVPFLSA